MFMNELSPAAGSTHVAKRKGRGIGTGNGTDAEGWMTDAVAFWEQHTS